MTEVRRCAVYTRKSTEEGLDRAFNSLDAQREACEAYIKSQAHEGWKLVKGAYDDGGFSGGSMERPALAKLMADVKQGLVDVIVVYKVDRLTRSLADFAKIVEVLDGQGASFVSVTQQFNTTTSMGRLTLNVLLSFAQFEREVTGERIRDKIAASKAKGMWMGGTPPTGYDLEDRRLIVNESQAELVRLIYRRYLELECVRALADDLKHRGILSKIKVSRRGNRHGGQPFGRGALYHLLQNRLYLGQIVHRGNAHQGQHAAIVPQELWDRVQGAIGGNRIDRRSREAKGTKPLLSGLVRDEAGTPMIPTETYKANGQRYRYYVSKNFVRGGKEQSGATRRIPAGEIEQLVETEIRRRFPVFEQKAWLSGGLAEHAKRLQAMIAAIVVKRDEIEITLTDSGTKELGSRTSGKRAAKVFRVHTRLAARAAGKTIETLDGEAPSGNLWDRALVRAVARANHWREMLERGEACSAYDLARHEECRVSYIQRHLPLAFLSPELVEAILDGLQPRSCTLKGLLEAGGATSW